MEYKEITAGNVQPVMDVGDGKYFVTIEKYKQEKDDDNAYIYKTYDHYPSKDEVKSFVESYYNQCIEEEIISGFKYEYQTVYLSLENQLNYQSIYDRIARGKMTYPIELKFGDAYVSFENESQYEKFYLAMRTYIDTTVEKGWKLKREFAYEKYDKDYNSTDS
jgi:hypothetical protein